MTTDDRDKAIVLYLRKHSFAKTLDIRTSQESMFVGTPKQLWSDLKRLEAIGVAQIVVLENGDTVWELTAASELVIRCVSS